MELLFLSQTVGAHVIVSVVLLGFGAFASLIGNARDDISYVYIIGRVAL